MGKRYFPHSIIKPSRKTAKNSPLVLANSSQAFQSLEWNVPSLPLVSTLFFFSLAPLLGEREQLGDTTVMWMAEHNKEISDIKINKLVSFRAFQRTPWVVLQTR
jgi:hypothetical protein